MRQQMRFDNYIRIKSVRPAEFAYSRVSFVSFPSPVGMTPSKLLSSRSLPAHVDPKEGKASAVR